MTAREESDLGSFAPYIAKHEIVAAKTSNRVCIFCHFDAKGRIARYVVHYLTSLRQAGIDIYFVSNNEVMSDSELDKVRPVVTGIVLRKNVGYDFAAYLTGYLLTRKEHYEELIFANDSVYGPFYPLTDIFGKMTPYDFWGVTDAYVGAYHMQSYFWVFRLGADMLSFLDEQADRFAFLADKGEIVRRYELGMTQALIDKGFDIGVLCPNEKAVEIENKSDDPELLRLKENIRRQAARKINVVRKLRGLLSAGTRRRNAARIAEHSDATGIFSAWFTLVKYMGCPFIKVRMLKSPKMKTFHEGRYVELLRHKYPQFDLSLIEDHLQKGL